MGVADAVSRCLSTSWHGFFSTSWDSLPHPTQGFEPSCNAVQVKLSAVETDDLVPGCIDKTRLDSLMQILTVYLQLAEEST